MTVNILGTEYEILIQNDNPKMKDSDGFCEWMSKKIIIADSYRTDEDALENIDEYIHKVIRHEAFHALFAEMGIKKWLHDEELIDMLAMQYPKIKKIMDKCDEWNFGKDEPREQMITIDFICGALAELFNSPCNFSPMDEYMPQDEYCKHHCGKVADKDCWKRYFEKRWANRKIEPQTDCQWK